MHVLIFNWRDIKNPKSGGAEILTHEISKKLIKKGHKVTQFSSSFKGGKKKENIDGVQIIREGHPDLRTLFASVHYKAYLNYKKRKFGDVDLIIDEVHGIPFFTPLYAKEKKVALVCEFAGDLWDKAVSPPFNYFGKIFEKIYPIFYKRVKIITISESSKKQLRKNLFKNNEIEIIHPGCTTPTVSHPHKKPEELNLVFIARLAKSKGVEDAIQIVKHIRERGISCVLHVIGRGSDEYVNKIKKLINDSNLEQNILLYGFISEKEKISLIDKSHFLVITSDKEGWGLTVHEANARGVPVISYDIDGVRDVVKNGQNGNLVKRNPFAVANQILTVYKDKKLYNFMVKKALEERSKYTWEQTYKEFMLRIKK